MAKVYKRSGPRLNLINSLRHSAHPSAKFCTAGSKNAKFCSVFDTSHSLLMHCGFKTKEHVGNVIVAAWATMIESRSHSDISLTRPLIFTQGSNIPKFGLMLDSEALQFRNEAMHLKFEFQWDKPRRQDNDYSISSPYLTYVAPSTLRIRHCDIVPMKNWPINCV